MQRTKYKEYKEFYDNYIGEKVSYNTFLRNLYIGRKFNNTCGKGEPPEMAIKPMPKIDRNKYLKNGIKLSTLKSRYYNGIPLDIPYQGRGGARKRVGTVAELRRETGSILSYDTFRKYYYAYLDNKLDDLQLRLQKKKYRHKNLHPFVDKIRENLL